MWLSATGSSLGSKEGTFQAIFAFSRGCCVNPRSFHPWSGDVEDLYSVFEAAVQSDIKTTLGEITIQ